MTMVGAGERVLPVTPGAESILFSSFVYQYHSTSQSEEFPSPIEFVILGFHPPPRENRKQICLATGWEGRGVVPFKR